MSTIDVEAGKVFTGVVAAGDTLVMEAGGATDGALICGTEQVDGGGLSMNDTIEQGGYLISGVVSGTGSVENVKIAGGTVNPGPSVALTGSVDFSGPGGLLDLPESLATPIIGFGTGDGIAFGGAAPDGTSSLDVVGDSATLTTPFSTYEIDVVGADGEARPVRWLGRQTVATRFADPLRVAPTASARAPWARAVPCATCSSRPTTR